MQKPQEIRLNFRKTGSYPVALQQIAFALVAAAVWTNIDVCLGSETAGVGQSDIDHSYRLLRQQAAGSAT